MAALPSSGMFILSASFTMKLIVFSVIFLVSGINSVSDERDDSEETYNQFYEDGVAAYLEGRWFECASFMQLALNDRKIYRETLAECRLKCQNESTTNVERHGFLELAFFDMALRRSDCIRRCKFESIGNRDEAVNEEVEEAFDTMQPYDYLQICSYKSGNFEMAASAAFTFLAAHPDHTTMKNNVQFYRTMEEIKPSYFKNLEARPHQALYEKGVEAYGDEEWLMVVQTMEEALQQYYLEQSRCQLLCMGPFDHDGTPDFYNALADHWIGILQCKEKCPRSMAVFYGSEIENYLAEHYNYLQFSYYKLGDLDKAAACVATYLLFKPNDEIMSRNKEFYHKQNKVAEELFVVRPEALAYHEHHYHEKRMLMFAQRQYRTADADLEALGRELEERARILEEIKNPKPGKVFGPKNEAYDAEMRAYEKRGIKIVAKEDELNGQNRMASDGLLSAEDCESLIRLAQMGATQGDGYKGTEHRTSPHTNYEKFEGLTVVRAAELARDGIIPTSLAELYLNTAETSRLLLQKYLNLVKPLYFHFTHMVCRTALATVNQKDRDDLSHPVHADNCILKEDGTCLRVPPAYVQRDFSALVYLNEGFEGGDFFFAHNNLTVQTTVKPKCGRMVGFSASDYHGVQAITKGKRCAVAIWYTLEAKEQETGHAEARTILKMIENRNRKLHNAELKDLVDEKNIDIIMTEEELNGPERFAADNLSSQEECDNLINLANGGGIVGDGYQSGKERTSPHTNHEKFAGLTLTRAAQTGGVHGDGYKGTPGKLTSPHTEHELFEGLTVIRAAQLAASFKVKKEDVKLYLDMSEKGRHLVETYFNLDKPLYFDYTHLVCRTALDEKNVDRTDLSHPIHADNCIIQADGSCRRESPAYTQRDYSAIMYLNEEFSGGEFFFAHQNMTIQSSLRPKCGRFVGFNAANYHGVKAVLKGQRCAVAMWYTLDPRYKEQAHGIAHKMLGAIGTKAEGPMRPDHSEL